jgi:transketolase
MRLIPNMTVLDCGDATEVASVLDAAEAVDGPVYVRMLRGEVPRLFDKESPLTLGRMRALSKGDDVVVVSSGIATEEAMRGVKALGAKGVSITHFHVSTLKPFEGEPIVTAAETCRFGVITIENHLTVGGLGSLVAEAMAEAGVPVKLRRLGLEDQYAHGASRPYLMKKYGMDAAALVAAVEGLTGTTFGVEPRDLEAVSLTPAASGAKAEDL